AHTVPSFQRATEAMGFGVIEDTSSPDAPCDGLSSLDSTVDGNRQRVSTMEAYLPLRIALARQANLTLCTRATVCRVDGSHRENGYRADSVKFQKANLSTDKVFSVKVKREVVTDHTSIPVAWEVPMTASLTHLATSPIKGAFEFFNSVTIRGDSSLKDESSTLIPELKSNDRNVTGMETRLPDIEIMPLATSAMDDVEEHKRHFSKIGVFSLLTTLLQPKSRGTVRLRSTDPHDRPKVDLNLLSEPEDVVLASKAVSLALKLGDAIKEQGFPLLRGIYVPNSDESTEDMDKFIRHRARTTYHYSSTCRMASEHDAQAPGVVDESLRVHGISNLRICDANVFPRILACHMMAPVVMVAERCADMIKKSETGRSRS
ncbi:MAG: hypothetical protein Q9169_008299, partial [Polycauliona sp. 2 TL-2023]